MANTVYLSGSKEYADYLLRARREFEQGSATILNDVRDGYRRAAGEIRSDISNLTPGTLRQAHLTALQTALDKRATQMSKEVLAATHQGIWMASGAGSKGVADVTAHMVQGVFPAVKVEKMFAGINERATLAMLARTRQDGLKISDRVWRTSESARNNIRIIVEDAVARGQDARTTAKQVQQYLQPGVFKPHKLEVRQRLRIDTDVSYQAMRLARTEMNNAFHEGMIAANQHNPGYRGIFWRLSGAHVVPDVCCMPGTMITTRIGLKAIEQVIIGDEVLTHRGRWQLVSRLYQRKIQDGELVRLRYQGARSHILEVTLTPNHPVLTGQGWVSAGSLQKGCSGLASPLWQHELSFLEVIKLVNKQHFNAKNLMVYNLEVAQDNSYFANGVAVHNCTDMAADMSHGESGFYPKGKEPVRPHPSCRCVAISAYEDPDQFTERLREWRDNPSLHSDIDAWYNHGNTRQILGRPQV